MDKLIFAHSPYAESSPDSEPDQPRPSIEHYQPISFAGMDARVHSTEQTLLSALSPAQDLFPQSRQLMTLNVSPHSATEYLPQPDPPQLDSPSPDPFLALSIYQPIRFDEEYSLEPFGDLGLISEPLEEGLINTSIPAQTTQNRPAPERSVTITLPEDTIESSIGEHVERSLLGSIKRSKQAQCSTRKRSTTKTTTKKVTTTKKKRMATTATATVLSAGPAIVSDSVPVTVQSNVLPAADHSVSKLVSDDSDQWFIATDSKKRLFRCSYPECSKTYKRKRNMVNHYINKHINSSKYRCHYPECIDKPSFRDTQALNRHIRANHTHERPYKCNICNQKFGRLDHMKNHKKSKHSNRDKKKPPK